LVNVKAFFETSMLSKYVGQTYSEEF